MRSPLKLRIAHPYLASSAWVSAPSLNLAGNQKWLKVAKSAYFLFDADSRNESEFSFAGVEPTILRLLSMRQNFAPFLINATHLAPVVQKMDNAIHRINHHPLDCAIDFAISYPLDSDLSVG